MENPLFVHLADPRGIIADKNGDLWLPVSESPQLNKRIETIQCAGMFFDVIGYSEVREALLLAPIKVEGSADNLEQELAELDGKQ